MLLKEPLVGGQLVTGAQRDAQPLRRTSRSCKHPSLQTFTTISRTNSKTTPMLHERTSEDGKAAARRRLSISSGSADWAARRTRVPTCRIRLWCSGGGGPPSGEVLQEEAIFRSLSEPPPLE